jgi:hypothetical protein
MDSIDARLEAMLREPEPAIGNDGFTETVMTALRATRRDATTGRWTLGAAVVAGSLLAALIGAPLDLAFVSLVPAGGYATSALTWLFVAFVAVPAVWVFYSE